MKAKTLILVALFSFALISEAACTNKKNAKPSTEKEIKELTLLLTKYCNNSEGVPPLHYAIFKKDMKAINLFLKHGADPKALDHNKYSCLYYAIKAGSIPLIKKFIALGNSIFNCSNNESPSGNNALQACLNYTQYEAAKYLLKTRLHTPEMLEGSCFFLAAYKTGNFSIDQRKELVKLMVQHGLDLNSTVVRDRTQLQELLLRYPKDTEMADFLRSLGAE